MRKNEFKIYIKLKEKKRKYMKLNENCKKFKENIGAVVTISEVCLALTFYIFIKNNTCL